MWTRPIRRLLVPVDFSAPSGVALRLAAALADRHEGEIRILHAETLEAPPYFTPGQVEALERERHAARAAAVGYVREFAAAATARPVTVLVEDGSPAEAVLKAAPGHDLIVMGTHGRRGVARWWLGSVAEQVLRAAGVPVLVVPPGDVEVSQVFERVVWVDGDSPESAARHWATTLALPFGGLAVQAPPTELRDAARHLDATLMVVAAAPESQGAALDRVLALTRDCARPVLFVPEPAGAPA